MLKLRNLATALLLCYWAALLLVMHVPIPRAVSGHVSISDKVVHFAAYALLAFLVACVFRSRRHRSPRVYFWILLALVVYGLFDEAAQIPIPGRTADIWDCLADSCGAAFGLIVHLFWMSCLESVFRRPASRSS